MIKGVSIGIFLGQNSLILFNSIPSVQLSMETLKEWDKT